MVAVTHRPPSFSPADAERLARELYGLAAAAAPLPGEHDQNFRLAAASGETFVLRIAHAAERRELLEMQCAALEHAAARAPGLRLQRVARDLAGSPIAVAAAEDGAPHLVRLQSFLPGRLMADSRPHSPLLLERLGRALGELDRALLDFEHPAAARPLKWDLAQALWARDYLGAVADPRQRALAAAALDDFARVALPVLPALRQSVIHNDANDYNVVVGWAAPGDPQVGLIDFGDMVRTATVAELAIACAYAMLDKPDPLAAAAAVVAGYHAELPLEEREVALLLTLVRARLAVSVVNSSHHLAAEPGNEYLQVSARPAWALLERLAALPRVWAEGALRAACGMAPWPAARRVAAWLAEHGGSAAPVVAPDLRTARALVLDLSVGSADLGNVPDFSDPLAFGAQVERQIREAGAAAAIGQYDEARPIYRAPLFQVPGPEGPLWRSVHLGLDIFQPAGAPIFAPLAGAVHSLRDNAGALDYGPTIILRHEPEGCPPFFTLYGHLSRESLAGLRVGEAVAAGQQIATIGDAAVNGGWPPHLHMQVMADMLERDGEFPGVGLPSERRLWAELCPDPNLLVGVPAAAFPKPAPDQAAILAERRERVGYNLSISYRRPLHIVRGFMQHLYDADGQQYLDSVNNVPHVGHQHPRVVRAAQRQMAVLNTNTRYLHAELVRYAERLTAHLPGQLKVCFFVCSGSEATELAIRLARAYTGQKDLIVSDGAYHGNTNTLIEISPYKSEGPGGRGLAPWVHKAPMPDVYRGPVKAGDAGAGAAYARMVEPIVERVRAEGRGLSGFIIESLLSCGGQIVLPDGYLPEVYRIVRGAGGVCIADEVQVGFGRVGSHFWGFETQGVVPDIVAMGKPIGNGHPLGAVVTTPEIAAAFDNGMEYFNTYGGNPVSCAVGQAVLDVIEEEGLQARAARVGGRMLAGLRELMGRHPIIGDVRGQGLMLGFELVRDRETLEPADWEASYVANRMREKGVLFSTDGPLHNVIKIKPPLVYSEADSDRLVAALDEVLADDVLR